MRYLSLDAPNSLSIIPLSSLSFIQSLPADKHASHDIRLELELNNIWTTIATTHPELEPNVKSKDTFLELRTKMISPEVGCLGRRFIRKNDVCGDVSWLS